MSKIGVGVGDEFPVDDGAPKPPPTNPDPAAQEQADRAEFEEWKHRRDAYRAQREAWRASREEWRRRRHDWKDQWRAQRRAWRDEFHDGRHGRSRGAYPFHYGPWRIVAAVAAVALIIFALSHIGLFIVGLAALAVLFVAYHHYGHDPLDFGPHDTGRPPPSGDAA
jgi:Flp pilus assembly protein TadB